MENAKEVFAAGRAYTLMHEDKNDEFYTYELDDQADMGICILYGIFNYTSSNEKISGLRFCASMTNTQTYVPAVVPHHNGEMDGFSRAEAYRKAREYLAELNLDADSLGEPEIYFLSVEDMNKIYLDTHPDETEPIFAEGDECYYLRLTYRISDNDIYLNNDNCPEIRILLNRNEILSIEGNFLFHEAEPLEDIEIKTDAYAAASKVSEYYSKQFIKADVFITDCRLLYVIYDYDSDKKESRVKPMWVFRGHKANEDGGPDWKIVLYVDAETGVVTNNL